MRDLHNLIYLGHGDDDDFLFRSDAIHVSSKDGELDLMNKKRLKNMDPLSTAVQQEVV